MSSALTLYGIGNNVCVTYDGRVRFLHTLYLFMQKERKKENKREKETRKNESSALVRSLARARIHVFYNKMSYF